MGNLHTSLYPGCLRRRFVPSRRQVVTEEVDREFSINDDKDSNDLALVAALVKKQPNEDDKEEVRGRLNDLATFALVGFGLFTNAVGNGPYNRERKSTALRQVKTERDALWDMGIRVPLGNKFSHASDALPWRCLQESNISEDTILLSGCRPKPQEVYDKFAPTSKEKEPRGEHPESVDQFSRRATQHIGIWCLLFAKSHKE